jgi:antitoxin MazE
METTIIKIGNSQGLIIPKKMLKPFGENTKFDMQLKDGGLFVVPLAEDKSRKNWEKQFAEAIKKGYMPDDEENEFTNDFDKEEWTW